ncbi:hypothetical protein Sxan_63400 [Streptomyces xanthophaeus]|uniref:Uncharacterized protein n=1 Tax=Streptomyces xanthophaeus TaxID=67385 RepID=A0A919H6C7_9ACTN|nr:hypothetical protein Sxan_63400 [Streptomyces xanthophaeus]
MGGLGERVQRHAELRERRGREGDPLGGEPGDVDGDAHRPILPVRLPPGAPGRSPGGAGRGTADPAAGGAGRVARTGAGPLVTGLGGGMIDA